MPKKKRKHKKIKHRVHHSGDENLEKILIENFVSLQKVMVNLSVKFESLSTQISKLLNLFEISAKALAEKDFKTEKEDKDMKKIGEKIDNIFEQNKVIARGLTLLHEKPGQESFMPPRQGGLMQRMKFEMGEMGSDVEGYQKSISSGAPPKEAPISGENTEE